MKPFINTIGFVKNVIDTEKSYKKIIIECDQSYVYNEQEYISFGKFECIYYEKNEVFKTDDLVFASGVLTLTTKEDKLNSIMCSHITNLSDSIEQFKRRKKELTARFNSQQTNKTKQSTNQSPKVTGEDSQDAIYPEKKKAWDKQEIANKVAEKINEAIHNKVEEAEDLPF